MKLLLQILILLLAPLWVPIFLLIVSVTLVVTIPVELCMGAWKFAGELAEMILLKLKKRKFRRGNKRV